MDAIRIEGQRVEVVGDTGFELDAVDKATLSGQIFS
jgi:hypothetical protein